ncbi:MAG: hypothetical protein RBT22_11230 [Aliarcobacter sp.]|jgi:hypothetical protein|nr:hypothetical protein [Aliarcobacter sp.]
MINFIKKIFTKNDLEEELLNDELKKSKIFLLEKKDLILKHIKNEMDLNVSNNYISKEEKEKLGLNVRLKISKELINIFNLAEIKEQNPKELLLELKLRIIHKISKLRDLKNAKGAKINKIKLLSAGDERTCKWCLDIEKEIIDITKIDLIKLIDDNCTCKYNRSTTIGVFE